MDSYPFPGEKMNIADLFPWSSEARILNAMIMERGRDNNWLFISEIANMSGVSARNVPSRIEKLILLDIVEKEHVTDKRAQWAYRLKDSSRSAALIRLQNELL